MNREKLQRLKKYLQRKIIAKLVPYETAIRRDYLERSHYAYCCLHSALLAKKLGIKEISAIEFGVAKGNGLLALEKICSDVTQITGINFKYTDLILEKDCLSQKATKICLCFLHHFFVRKLNGGETNYGFFYVTKY